MFFYLLLSLIVTVIQFEKLKKTFDISESIDRVAFSFDIEPTKQLHKTANIFLSVIICLMSPILFPYWLYQQLQLLPLRLKIFLKIIHIKILLFIKKILD